MTEQTLVFGRNDGARFRWVRIAAIGVALVPTVTGAVEHQPWRVLVWGLITALAVAGYFLRPRTEVSADGIRTSMMRRRFSLQLSWSEIEAVIKPAPFDRSAQVLLTDGRVRPVSYATPADAAAIAAVGGKQLRVRPPAAGPAVSPPAAPRRIEKPSRTPAQVEESVAAEGERLRSELRRLRGEQS